MKFSFDLQVRRAINSYEKGVKKEDCGCLYRIGMAYLLGQLGFEIDIDRALRYLELAALRSDLDTPQPGYVLGMVRAGEFEGVQLGRIAVDLEFAKENIERSAFLGFGPAQLKMVSPSRLQCLSKTLIMAVCAGTILRIGSTQLFVRPTPLSAVLRPCLTKRRSRRRSWTEQVVPLRLGRTL